MAPTMLPVIVYMHFIYMRQLFDTCESCPWAHLFETSVHPFLKFNEFIQVDRCLHKSVFPSPFQFPPFPFSLFLTSPPFIHPSFSSWTWEPESMITGGGQRSLGGMKLFIGNGVTYKHRKRRVERAKDRIWKFCRNKTSILLLSSSQVTQKDG